MRGMTAMAALIRAQAARIEELEGMIGEGK